MTAKDNVETFVLESSLDLCQKVRSELQMHFDSIWIFLYLKSPKSKTATITVCNSFAGKLEKSFSTEIVSYAREFHSKLKE